MPPGPGPRPRRGGPYSVRPRRSAEPPALWARRSASRSAGSGGLRGALGERPVGRDPQAGEARAPTWERGSRTPSASRGAPTPPRWRPRTARPGCRPAPAAPGRGVVPAAKNRPPSSAPRIRTRGYSKRVVKATGAMSELKMPPTHAADGNPEVEFRQMCRRRPCPGNLPMADHADEKEIRQVNTENRPPRHVDIGEICKEQSEHRQGQKQDRNAMDQGRNPGEDDDEGQEVERKRDDPKERDCGNVRAEGRRHPEQQARRNEGEQNPPAPLPPRQRGDSGAHARLTFPLRPAFGRTGSPASPQSARTQEGEEQEDKIADGPCKVLLGKPEMGLHPYGVADQGQHAAEVARAVEKIGIPGRWMTGPGEPPLKQRCRSRKDEKGRADGDQKQDEHLADRVPLR